MIRLMCLADREGIAVVYWHFAPPIKGMYRREPGMPPIIGLDYSILDNPAEHRSIMAEELGHHMTSLDEGICTTCFHYQDRIAVSKSEYKALRWAAQYLIKLPQIVQALQDGFDTYPKMAAYFQVTEELVRHRLSMVDAIEYLYNKDRCYTVTREG